MAEEATINPDGTQSFPNPTASDAGTEDEGIPEDIPEETIIDNDSTGGIDPAIYLALAAVVFTILFIVMRRRRKRATADVDDFFSNLDGEKVSFFHCCHCLIGFEVKILFVGKIAKFIHYMFYNTLHSDLNSV